MQRSSERIGAIASALAKAQAALNNPEKSLTATIRASHPRDRDQIFKYAALSSGLDIVRKALGSHEIATVQTTSIDKDAGLIRLTTTLAHASGEWLSSEWPVCAIADTNSPRRMGAALTYARRYALFTLVGIAGEDDMDAPDLNDGVGLSHQQSAPLSDGAGSPLVADPSPVAAAPSSQSARLAPNGNRGAKSSVLPTRFVLPPDASAECRDRLIAEVAELTNADAAAEWVHRSLPLKNTLTLADAQLLETRFKERLAVLALAIANSDERPICTPNNAMETTVQLGAEPEFAADQVADLSPAAAAFPIEPSPPAVPLHRRRRLTPKPIRLRDKEHCNFVARQPCLICGRSPSEAHHIRFAQPRALGRKVSDEYTVPVCRIHHRELHHYGDEASWWAGVGVDPVRDALKLWRRSHPQTSLPEESL